MRLILKANSPLLRGKRYELNAKFKATDCYISNTESAAITPTDQVDVITFKITLPATRPAKRCTLFRLVGDDRVPMPGRYRFSNGHLLKASVNFPTPSGMYVLQWDW